VQDETALPGLLDALGPPLKVADGLCPEDCQSF
jgi:hypothetical protein